MEEAADEIERLRAGFARNRLTISHELAPETPCTYPGSPASPGAKDMTVTGPPDDYTDHLKTAAHEALSMTDIVERLRGTLYRLPTRPPTRSGAAGGAAESTLASHYLAFDRAAPRNLKRLAEKGQREYANAAPWSQRHDEAFGANDDTVEAGGAAPRRA